MTMKPQRCTSTIVEPQGCGFHDCGANREEEHFHDCGAMTWHKVNMKKEKEGVHKDNANGAKELIGHFDNFS